MSTTDAAARIAQAWTAALEVWGVQTSLSPPEKWTKGKGAQADEPIAYIDLSTRQVVVNLEILDRMGAGASLTAVLAHEIGHHVRFPHTLGLAASLQMLERRLIPGLGQSLTNLFFDLLVNEYVGHTHAADLAEVYRGFQRLRPGDEMPPLFAWYLAVYEELWSRSLLPAGREEQLEKQHPGFRSDARVFVQTFYGLPTIHRQFVYFCSRAIRFIPDPSKVPQGMPMASDMPSPDLDDVDGAIRGHGSEETDDALREAKEKGWFDDTGVTPQEAPEPLESIRRVSNSQPGHGQAEFQRALVSKHYKRLVDQHIIELPAQEATPEAFLPSVAEDWEWGESPRLIDWTASVLARGPLAAALPLKRDQVPDDPPPGSGLFPEVEIYLDTSGSMPDPASSLNTMTLAAQILAASALRKGGKVRGVIYSSGPCLVSEWMSDEETARDFLLNYAGGGTDYPFASLKKSAIERDDVLRVIVSDSDFLSNVSQAGAMELLKFGIDHSRLLVAFLAARGDYARKTLAPVLAHARFRLALIEGYGEFAKAAAALADALMPSRAPQVAR